jgi:hypothetical protein
VDDLSAVAHGSAVLDDASRHHVEHCLHCQAELVQHRKLLRALASLRHELLLPAPGLLSEVLAAVEVAGERTALRAILSGRRAAYLSGLAAATAAGAAGAIVIATRAKRSKLGIAS